MLSLHPHPPPPTPAIKNGPNTKIQKKKNLNYCLRLTKAGGGGGYIKLIFLDCKPKIFLLNFPWFSMCMVATKIHISDDVNWPCSACDVSLKANMLLKKKKNLRGFALCVTA